MVSGECEPVCVCVCERVSVRVEYDDDDLDWLHEMGNECESETGGRRLPCPTTVWWAVETASHTLYMGGGSGSVWQLGAGIDLG